MIFEGLAGVAATGTGEADDPVEIALARIRQLSAHEVGHTLGFAHNFAASSNDRASVMDYPAPYVRPTRSGGLDFSNAYAVGLGAWDVFTVKWLYSQFPEGEDEDVALEALVKEAYSSGLRFVGDRHGRSVGTAHPYGSVWDNGEDAIATLLETLDVRRIALEDFGLDRLAEGRPTSDLNAVIVPIYLYHRYQTAAAAKYIGGLEFQYGVNGDGAPPARPIALADQQRALNAILATLDPAVLDLPDTVLNLLTPGDVGFAGGGDTAEVFPGRSGPVFDLSSASDIAAKISLGALFDKQRLERLLAYEQRDGETLTVKNLIDQTETAAFATTANTRHQPIARTVQSRFVSTLIDLAAAENTSASLSSIVNGELTALRDRLTLAQTAAPTLDRYHFSELVSRIDRHLKGEKNKSPPRPANATRQPDRRRFRRGSLLALRSLA